MIDRLRPYLPTAFLATLIFYFGVHALTGDRGLLIGARREEALAERKAALVKLQSERRRMEIEVANLSDDHLSRDLLEERARLLLGYADPRDYVIRNHIEGAN